MSAKPTIGHGRKAHDGLMRLHFLGAASTVTGSQFLLETDRAKILVDCGMFQGSPHEVMRNRVPFAYDPASIDALLLTHAHLDHCGLIPHLVAEGFHGPIYATRGTVELARLVLLDSAKLQEEFAQRHERFQQRHPGQAAHEDRAEQKDLDAAVADARVPPGETGVPPGETGVPPGETGNPEEAVRSQPPHVTTALDAPLYDSADAERALALFRGVEYGAELDVAPGVRASFLDAGHILGSAMIRLSVWGSGPPRGISGTTVPELRGEAPRSLVFSGDLGRPDTPIIRDPTRLDNADYVVVESTYGGREHEPEGEAVRLLAEAVRLVADAKGVLLVPSFAIGRTQEVVWHLDRLIESGTIPMLPLYLDSPMASKATDIYRRYGDYYDEETRALVASGKAPLDYPGAHVTNDAADSRAIGASPRPHMIVASNGMLTGGRVLQHLRELVGDPATLLLFVGYQGEGTLGARLQGGAKQIRIDGETHEVRCRVRSIGGFSAHADESEILDWLRGFTAPKLARRVFIVHGDPAAQQALEPKIRALGLDTHVPRWREAVELD